MHLVNLYWKVSAFQSWGDTFCWNDQLHTFSLIFIAWRSRLCKYLLTTKKWQVQRYRMKKSSNSFQRNLKKNPKKKKSRKKSSSVFVNLGDSIIWSRWKNVRINCKTNWYLDDKECFVFPRIHSCSRWTSLRPIYLTRWWLFGGKNNNNNINCWCLVYVPKSRNPIHPSLQPQAQ